MLLLLLLGFILARNPPPPPLALLVGDEVEPEPDPDTALELEVEEARLFEEGLKFAECKEAARAVDEELFSRRSGVFTADELAELLDDDRVLNFGEISSPLSPDDAWPFLKAVLAIFLSSDLQFSSSR